MDTVDLVREELQETLAADNVTYRSYQLDNLRLPGTVISTNILACKVICESGRQGLQCKVEGAIATGTGA